jgi:hypothetical protein
MRKRRKKKIEKVKKEKKERKKLEICTKKRNKKKESGH